MLILIKLLVGNKYVILWANNICSRVYSTTKCEIVLETGLHSLISTEEPTENRAESEQATWNFLKNVIVFL
jgi:hypothetical protein